MTLRHDALGGGGAGGLRAATEAVELVEEVRELVDPSAEYPSTATDEQGRLHLVYFTRTTAEIISAVRMGE